MTCISRAGLSEFGDANCCKHFAMGVMYTHLAAGSQACRLSQPAAMERFERSDESSQ
jgi:hypothetical protein